ncbi:hypothetical protein RRF57_003505 [Xylaria bambusicola]|uniref:Peptidyl-prolyl cis-trans isomerase n=1 Tax=Xylaria bambusicola TaxID=326684 RepID=A0AAN7U911_9PEZI
MAGKKNNNSKAKGDSKSGGDGDKGGGKLKGGQKIEVRHILCTKHSRKEEALAEIQRLTRGEPKEGAPPNAGKTRPKDKDQSANTSHIYSLRVRFSLPFYLMFDTIAGGLTNLLGGALGLKTKGSLHPEFERVAYSLQPTENGIVHIGEAKTDFGYHLIVVDKRL